MLVLCTRIPVRYDFTSKDFLDLFIEFVDGSRKYDITEEFFDRYDRTSYESFEDQSPMGVNVAIKHYKDQIHETVEVSACRLTSTDNNSKWILDVILYKDIEGQSILVFLNRENRAFVKVSKQPKPPFIVRMITDVQRKICADDGGIPVCFYPITAENNYSLCRDIINGKSENMMPVVYISSVFWGEEEKRTVAAKTIAKQLCGYAHVFIEREHDTANRLKYDTDSRNVRDGAIGIYYPRTKYCWKFSKGKCEDSDGKIREEVLSEIIEEIKLQLINRWEYFEYNWDKIARRSAVQAKLMIKEKSDKEKESLDKEKEIYNQVAVDNDKLTGENKQLKNDNNDLNENVQRQNLKIDALRAQLNQKNSAKGVFYNLGEEKPLYESEITDLLHSILSQVLHSYPRKGRPYTIIKSLLDANPRIGEWEDICKQTKKVFEKQSKLKQRGRIELEALGFGVEEGKHYKLTFMNEPRYYFHISKTPSDAKTIPNQYTKMRNLLDIERNIYSAKCTEQYNELDFSEDNVDS